MCITKYTSTWHNRRDRQGNAWQSRKCSKASSLTIVFVSKNSGIIKYCCNVKNLFKKPKYLLDIKILYHKIFICLPTGPPGCLPAVWPTSIRHMGPVFPNNKSNHCLNANLLYGKMFTLKVIACPLLIYSVDWSSCFKQSVSSFNIPQTFHTRCSCILTVNNLNSYMCICIYIRNINARTLLYMTSM